METQHHVRLTAPEIANIWSQYLSDTMAICFNKYALATIKDHEIRSIYEYALSLSESHVERLKEFFVQEKFPIPEGFTPQDVNTNAPRLFEDPLFLNYLYIMTLHGLAGYAAAVSTSIRSDIRKYYIQCNTETMILFDRITETMLAKGIYIRPPYINPPDMVQYVKHQNFLTGWMGERRPLTSIEINHITFNMNKMYLHAALKIGFSQAATSKKVRDYNVRGLHITNKHTEVFQSLFREDHLNSPASWDAMVTKSTVSPFSDKWIMFQIQLSTSAAVGFYGAALSVCTRKDICAHYVRLIGELMDFAKDGADIMIDHGWMEEPPSAVDRMALTKVKKNT